MVKPHRPCTGKGQFPERSSVSAEASRSILDDTRTFTRSGASYQNIINDRMHPFIPHLPLQSHGVRFCCAHQSHLVLRPCRNIEDFRRGFLAMSYQYATLHSLALTKSSDPAKMLSQYESASTRSRHCLHLFKNNILRQCGTKIWDSGS